MNRAIAALNAQATRLQAINITQLSKNLVAPKFNWDQGLKQTDQLVGNIQKGKLKAAEFFDLIRNRTNELAAHQARISQSFAQPLGGGGTAMIVPSVNAMRQVTTATELANRKLAIQAELWHGLGQKVQDWGKNTQWAGRQMMVGLTMPFAMGAAAAGMMANKIDQAMVRVEKVVNEPLEGFRDKAMNTAKEITNTMGQTVESTLGVMSELAASGKSGQVLQDMTKLSQKLATLGDMDQQESIKGLLSMQQIWRMDTDKLSESIDYLNYVEDQTPTKLQDLVDAIPIAGVQVAQLGGTLQDTTVLLTAFREKGIATVEGANAIKTAMNRILSPTKGARDTFKELTGKDLPALVAQTEGKPLETFQALSDVIMGTNISLADQQRIISKLVGTYQSSRITALMRGLREGEQDPKNSAVGQAMNIGEMTPEQWAAKTAASFNAVTQSASGQWKIAIESFKAELLETGNIMLKIATVIVKAATKVFSFFNSMPDVVKYVVIGIGALLAIVGPVTMLVGILGNFLGTFVKFGAVITGMRTKYKSMTLEQKLAELETGNLNSKMISQADTTQLLIYQMGQLKQAYLSTSAAAATAAGAMSPLPLSPMGLGGAGKNGQLIGTNAWAGQTGALLSNSGQNMQSVANETQKASKFAKVFNQEMLLGVGATAAVAGLVTDTNSGLSDWLNWISLGAVALGTVLPLVKSIGTAIKGWIVGGGLAGIASKFGGAAKGFGSGILSGGKKALGSLGAFLKGPWGIGIGIALAGIFAITKLIGAAQERQNEHQTNMVKSTDKWMSILGKTKLEWGQIRTESGEVKDNVDKIVDKMREEMPDTVNEMSNADMGYLQTLTEREAFKLEGQGLDKKEILYNLDALLQAAGRSREEIEKILGHIKVNFDFADGLKDLKAFIKNTRNDMSKELSGWVFDMSTDPASQDAGERSEQQDQTAERISGLFSDRLVGMDPAQRAIYANQFAKEMYDVYNDAFVKLDKQYGGRMAKNWNEARSKFFNFDKDEGKWKVDNEAASAAGVNPKEIHQMEILIDSEQRLAQAIARSRHVNEDKIKNMSVIKDVLPYVAKGDITAKEAQEAYNNAVKEAKDSGQEMTEEEKRKLAALVATQFNLDATTIANNGYSDSNKKSAASIRDQSSEMQVFIDQMRNFQGASDDFWSSQASGEGGFADALGGDVLQQTSTLTEQVKGIYSGAMTDVYSAFADQAQEQWQARLDAITQSFENRKNAIQKQLDAADKAYDAKQDAFQARWDNRMDRTKKAYENRQKVIEDTAEKQLDVIDKQIDAEQKREDARQKQFEAEQKRIERLTDLANRTIDYNRALASGNLDEAARVMNNAESVQVGYAAEDAQIAGQDESKKKIDALTARKDLIQKQKQVKLDALKEEEEAVEKSLQRQREMEQKSMERARDIERQRLQAKLDGLSREQQAAEKTERNKQEMDRRTLEIELATLKAFVPKNEAELNAHVKRISSAYANYGVNLQTAGGYWGKIVGNALSNNVNRARAEMSNNAQWAAFGSSVAGAISKGAFGLSLKDFFNLIATGQPPKGWKPPGQKKAVNTGKAINRPGGRMFFHDGGLVGTGSSTQGRGSRGNSPLGGDEVPTVLQRGEYVFPKSAVQLYGSEYLAKMAAGTPPKPQQTVGVAGMFGSVMGAMSHGIIALAMENLMGWAAAQYGGGGGTGAAVDFAKAQDGKPYMWGSAGPTGYDCSGYMSAIANVLTGKDNPYQRIFSTSMMSPGKSVGPFRPGLGDTFSIGVFNGNPGHTAGTLMGVNVESTGDHVRYGKDAHGATDKQFTMQFHIPENLIVEGAAMPGFGSIGQEGGMDKVQQRVKKIAALFGWDGGAEWNALYQLIQGESSWDPNAANPSSSARGLFQKMTSLHGPIETTVEGQAKWGLNYIKGAYGDPINAFAKWSSRNPHWYDSGGDVPPGLHMLYNGTNQTESMITHGRTSQLIKALDVASITYRGIEAKLGSFVPSVDSVASATGDTYNNEYNININGSGLNEKQLQTAIRNGIEEVQTRQAKRRGQRK